VAARAVISKETPPLSGDAGGCAEFDADLAWPKNEYPRDFKVAGVFSCVERATRSARRCVSEAFMQRA
jgi:hypothetical protein